jgi:putative ABC transport system permease protein
MMMLRLSWQQWLRDLKSGQLSILLITLCLAVLAQSTIGFFTDRLRAGLWRDAAQLLGGDVVLVSDKAPPPALISEARNLGLETRLSVNFPTMARTLNDAAAAEPLSRLVALKAVEPGYPLRGQVSILDAAGLPVLTRQIPEPGQAWVDPALLDALNLQVGDRMGLGDHTVTISARIDKEPDRGAGFMNFAPRVLIHAQDLPLTNLIQPASRVTYRLAMAGTDAQVKTSLPVLKERSSSIRGMQMESLESGRPEMRQTLDRAEKFLGLVGMLTTVLCALAMLLVARQYTHMRLDASAMLRVMGLTQQQLLAQQAFGLLLSGIVASTLGCLSGYGLHHIMVALLGDLINIQLPDATWRPVAQAYALGVALLLACGLPTVLQLAQVPALRVIRRELGQPSAAALSVWGFALLGIASLLVATAGNLSLGLLVLSGFAGAGLFFALCAWLVLKGLQRLNGPFTGAAFRSQAWAMAWSQMLRSLRARQGMALVQIAALSLGLTALLLLLMVRTDLLSVWNQGSADRAVNRFAINVQPDQREAFARALEHQGASIADQFPMFRGRLVHINGQAVNSENYKDDRAKRLVDREFNLSFTPALPNHNKLTQGQWRNDEPGVVSVEEGLAESLGLKLGDTLGFDIAGAISEARITSLRKVDWSAMRANFFVLFPVTQLADVPVTHLFAYKAGLNQRSDHLLVRDFPNVTVVDLSNSLRQVQQVLTQISMAVEFMFMLSFLAGLLVMAASLKLSIGIRQREWAILRALGASAQSLKRMTWLEWLVLGTVSGLLSSAVALTLGFLLTTQGFDLPWQPTWWLLPAGSVMGAAAVWSMGQWLLRQQLRQSVLYMLRA